MRFNIRRPIIAVCAAVLAFGTIAATPAQARYRGNAAVLAGVIGVFGTIAALAAAQSYRDEYGCYGCGYGPYPGYAYAPGPAFRHGHWHHWHHWHH